MTRYALAVLMLPCVLCAQEKKQEERPRPENMVTRMIHLEHADPHQVRNLLAGTGARVQWDDQLRVVVVSGSPSEMVSVEQTVKELDAEMAKVPVSNADFTFYVLGASQEERNGGPIPANLQRTVDQIKSAFSYPSYQLLETGVARARIGSTTQISGSLQPFRGEDPRLVGRYPSYKIQFLLAGIANSRSKNTFRIQRFYFQASVPVAGPPPREGTTPSMTMNQESSSSIQADFDISSNQQVVIGKAGVAGNNAVFLIVEAKAVK
jgi:hypothetical protein